MHPAIEKIIPLVGKVKWDINPASFEGTTSLQMKLMKHTNQKNVEKLKIYMALCIQTWPEIINCPIERQVLKAALDCIQSN